MEAAAIGGPLLPFCQGLAKIDHRSVSGGLGEAGLLAGHHTGQTALVVAATAESFGDGGEDGGVAVPTLNETNDNVDHRRVWQGRWCWRALELPGNCCGLSCGRGCWRSWRSDVLYLSSLERVRIGLATVRHNE